MEIKIIVEGPIDLDTVIGEHYVYDDEDGHREPRLLVDALVDELARRAIVGKDEGWASLRQRVESIRTEMIRERVAVEIEAAMTNPYPVTNHYGEPSGKVTTLREEIVRLAGEALRMDRSNAYSRRPTKAETVILEAVDLVMAKELHAVVADEKAKVVAAVRAKAADLIATAVKEGVGR